MDNLSGTEKICPEREIEKRKRVNWGQGNDTGQSKNQGTNCGTQWDRKRERKGAEMGNPYQTETRRDVKRH